MDGLPARSAGSERRHGCLSPLNLFAATRGLSSIVWIPKIKTAPRARAPGAVLWSEIQGSELFHAHFRELFAVPALQNFSRCLGIGAPILRDVFVQAIEPGRIATRRRVDRGERFV